MSAPGELSGVVWKVVRFFSPPKLSSVYRSKRAIGKDTGGRWEVVKGSWPTDFSSSAVVRSCQRDNFSGGMYFFVHLDGFTLGQIVALYEEGFVVEKLTAPNLNIYRGYEVLSATQKSDNTNFTRCLERMPTISNLFTMQSELPSVGSVRPFPGGPAQPQCETLPVVLLRRLLPNCLGPRRCPGISVVTRLQCPMFRHVHFAHNA